MFWVVLEAGNSNFQSAALPTELLGRTFLTLAKVGKTPQAAHYSKLLADFTKFTFKHYLIIFDMLLWHGGRTISVYVKV